MTSRKKHRASVAQTYTDIPPTTFTLDENGKPVLSLHQMQLLLGKHGYPRSARAVSARTLKATLHSVGYAACGDCYHAGAVAIHPMSAMMTCTPSKAWSSGVRPACKRCHASRVHVNGLAHPARVLWGDAKKRATHRGTPFTITLANVQQLLDDTAAPNHGAPFGICPVRGVPMRYMQDQQPGINSLTLDAVSPEAGYIPGNLVLLSHATNSTKSDLGTEAILRGCAYMSRDRIEQSDDVNTADSREWRTSVFHAARNRASKKGVPFALVREDIKMAATCPCCSKDLNYTRGRGGRQKPDSATVDRRTPSLGYVASNITTVCSDCNRSMGSLDAGTLFVLAEWLSEALTLRGLQSPFTGAEMASRILGNETEPEEKPLDAVYSRFTRREDFALAA